jgi:HK97 family phage portal protein
MKFKLFGRTWEIRASTSLPSLLSSDSSWQAYLLGLGYTVSADTALQISAVFRCVDIISKTIAALPLHLFRNTERGKEKAVNHRLYPLIYALPNPQTTSYEFWQMYVANLLLTRGAFAKIDRSVRGFIRALWNIPTSRVNGIQVNAANGERYIDITHEDNTIERLREGEFMYTPGFLFGDRHQARDPVVIASEVLGLTSSIAQYAKQAVNGVNPGGFIEYPAGLSDKAYERFKSDFNDTYKGAMNAGKFLFIEEGGKANLFERDMEKMQVLESRKWAVTEVCRIFGVPAHLCMDMEHATFSNIEQQSLEYVRDCVAPMVVRLEQSMYRDLLTETERQAYYFKFNLNGLLRADTQTRASYYNTMRQTGIMSTNDVRRLEDMDEIPAEAGGDDLHVNGNMITLGNARANIPKGAQAGTVAKRTDG